MFKPTLKKEEVIFIKDEVLKKTSLSLVKHVVTTIKEDSINTLGSSAFIHMLFKVAIPKQVATFYKPKREMAKGAILKSLTASDLFIAKSVGLPIMSGGELFVLKSVEVKGASSPAFNEARIIDKNRQANTEIEHIVNGAEFKAVVAKSAELAKKAIGYSLEERNANTIAAHKLRFPSFVFMLLKNQKIRSFGSESKELEQYNTLVTRVSEFGTASLSQIESDTVRGFNKKLINDLGLYIKQSGNFNFDKFDTDYRSLLMNFIAALSPNDLRMTLTDEKSLLRICNSWKGN